MAQEGRLGFGGYLSGEEAGLGVVPQGRRLVWGFFLRGGDWNMGYPSGEKPTFGVVPQERIWQQIALCVF